MQDVSYSVLHSSGPCPLQTWVASSMGFSAISLTFNFGHWGRFLWLCTYQEKQMGNSPAIISIFFCHILSCIAETSKHLAKRNIGQFNHTLWPSFAQQNVLDKLNIFLRYHHIKMQKWWNSDASWSRKKNVYFWIWSPTLCASGSMIFYPLVTGVSMTICVVWCHCFLAFFTF